MYDFSATTIAELNFDFCICGVREDEHADAYPSTSPHTFEAAQ